MNKNHLWSLRLGYSGKQAQSLSNLGIKRFLEKSFNAPVDKNLPDFLKDSPKTIAEFKALRQEIKDMNDDEKKVRLKAERKTHNEMQVWWLQKMMREEFPLREKMTCFWHNHFVATFQKVKVNYWVFQHNQLLREHAFGNFKTLVKEVVQTNAMVKYLDNVDNKAGKINENLSRELLELFTLGIGNYTENDIKNGAKGLAGLGLGNDKAIYYPRQKDDDPIEYLGKKGVLKVDDLIDAIFEQTAAPYLITRKILKWFIYDNPSEALVRYYGDYFRAQNFEIKPLLTKIFLEEFEKENAASKIKDPLLYSLHLLNELQVEYANLRVVATFLRQQGMELFNQPNVKGWDGGNSWLSSQLYLQRGQAADWLCSGKNVLRHAAKNDDDDDETTQKALTPKLLWNKKVATNKEVIAELTNRLLGISDADLQADCEQLLKYDFDPSIQTADNAVLRLFNFIIKTPEFQLI